MHAPCSLEGVDGRRKRAGKAGRRVAGELRRASANVLRVATSAKERLGRAAITAGVVGGLLVAGTVAAVLVRRRRRPP